MIEGKTKSGFHYSIPEEALDDMELVDALSEMDDGNITSYRYAMKALLGEDQRKELYEFLRDKKTGRVSARAVFKAFSEILTNAKDQTNDIKHS